MNKPNERITLCALFYVNVKNVQLCDYGERVCFANMYDFYMKICDGIMIALIIHSSMLFLVSGVANISVNKWCKYCSLIEV